MSPGKIGEIFDAFVLKMQRKILRCICVATKNEKNMPARVGFAGTLRGRRMGGGAGGLEQMG